jgi:hypothetical protein
MIERWLITDITHTFGKTRQDNEQCLLLEVLAR